MGQNSRLTVSTRTVWIVAGFVALFQLFTLNKVFLNGDEAIYIILGEEIQKFFATGKLNLHPMVPYLGPLDYLVMGSLYWLSGKFTSGFAGAWLVRVIPWAVFWSGLVVLYRELRRWSEKHSSAALFMGAISPLPLIYARGGFPHAILLGFFCILLAEAFRLLRTGQVRWWVLGLIGGMATEFHTTAFLGFIVVFGAVADRIWAAAKKQPLRAAGAALLYLLLALPELMEFPPPTGGAPGGSIFLEIRNFVNVLDGIQPFVWLFRTDFGGNILPLLFFALLVVALGVQVSELFAWHAGGFREAGSLPNALRRFWFATFAGTAFMFFMGWRGRSLLYIGHERYLLMLVPLWVVMQPDAFLRLAERARGFWNGRWVWVALLLLSFGRFAVTLTRFSFETEPGLRSAHWLVENCPRDRCLAYAETFWNYWAIRYYTRDVIDVNYITDNWKKPAQHEQGNREIATCLFTGDKPRYAGPYRLMAQFPAEAAGLAQVCYLGADLRFVSF